MILAGFLLFFSGLLHTRPEPILTDVYIALNALTTFDFTLTPNSHKVDYAAKRPASTAVPFSMVEGRMAVKARMGQETLTLILDSGATNIVLFRRSS